jgi:hypothetical protein
MLPGKADGWWRITSQASILTGHAYGTPPGKLNQPSSDPKPQFPPPQATRAWPGLIPHGKFREKVAKRSF